MAEVLKTLASCVRSWYFGMWNLKIDPVPWVSLPLHWWSWPGGWHSTCLHFTYTGKLDISTGRHYLAFIICCLFTKCFTIHVFENSLLTSTQKENQAVHSRSVSMSSSVDPCEKTQILPNVHPFLLYIYWKSESTENEKLAATSLSFSTTHLSQLGVRK